MECEDSGVLSGECSEVQSLKCKVSTVECGVRSAKCKVQCKVSRVWS